MPPPTFKSLQFEASSKKPILPYLSRKSITLNMKIRALCTDIDGTLLDSRRELSPRTIAAIKHIHKKLPVILASSRMPSAMRHLQQELGIPDHPMICFNGGYVVHFTEKSLPIILDSVHIPASICSAIVSLTQKTDIHVSLFAEDHWYAAAPDRWTEREQQITKVSPQITAFDPILERWHEGNTGAHKVMCMGPEHEIQDMETLLTEKFSSNIHIYRSKSTYLEIAPKTISKATALELVLKTQFNIDMTEAMAFGDNYNDIDMLQSVGLGIAVANAREEVKAIAKEITLKNVDDGVAVAIEKYCI